MRALHIANGTTKKIRIFTDSKNAKDWILNPRKEGHMAYMWESLCEATKEKGTEIEISWVKGHAGNKGNERADALARKATTESNANAGKGCHQTMFYGAMNGKTAGRQQTHSRTGAQGGLAGGQRTRETSGYRQNIIR